MSTVMTPNVPRLFRELIYIVPEFPVKSCYVLGYASSSSTPYLPYFLILHEVGFSYVNHSSIYMILVIDYGLSYLF